MFNYKTKQALRDGSLRLIHNIEPGYRYWVTNSFDKEVFCHNKKFGANEQGLTYYVYFDDDINPDYRSRYVVLSHQQ